MVLVGVCLNWFHTGTAVRVFTYTFWASFWMTHYSLNLGTLDFLERPTVVFVRLKESVALDSALEAPQPVRFVFVLVGPSKDNVDYRETGRAMAALMADKVGWAVVHESLKCPVSPDTALCSLIIPSVISTPDVQSGSLSGKECSWPDGCCGQLHGLQHRHSTHWDPEWSNAHLNYQLPEETAAGQAKDLQSPHQPGLQAPQGWVPPTYNT